LYFPCPATTWKNYSKKKEAALKKRKVETIQGIEVYINQSISRWHRLPALKPF